MKKIITLIMFLSIAIAFSACGTGRLMVTEPVVIPACEAQNGVVIQRSDDTVPVPNSVKSNFEKMLSKKLFADGVVRRGRGVTLKYRFIKYNEGNQLARYLLGGLGNTGEASMMIEVCYLDSRNNSLGKIQTEGRISSGILGGSSDYALSRAAGEVADYTRNIVLKSS